MHLARNLPNLPNDTSFRIGQPPSRLMPFSISRFILLAGWAVMIFFYLSTSTSSVHALKLDNKYPHRSPSARLGNQGGEFVCKASQFMSDEPIGPIPGHMGVSPESPQTCPRFTFWTLSRLVITDRP